MSKKIQVVSPIDQSVYCERIYASNFEIEGTLELANKATQEWKRTTIQERADICRKAVAYLVDHADHIGEEITRQMGRPIRYSPGEISTGLCERAEYMIDVASDKLGNFDITPKRYLKREPLGTVLVLAPWNYPFLTSVNSIIPALMAGNTVVLKHSDQTPLTAERYQEAFDAAGLPEGVFQYLHVDHRQVSEIIKDCRIHHVAFTGSLEGGHAIQKASSGRFISAGLELGGKDAAYVREDANVQLSAENLVDGAFFNSGQSCCGIERIYVHENNYDEFLEMYVSITKSYVMGNPLDPETQIGPMVRTKSTEYVLGEIEKAVKKGATRCINNTESNRDAFLYPEVLTHVDHSMSIMQKETFGPVVGIMKVSSDQEAIQLINDSDYGLTASIWTADVDKARDIGDQLEVGTVYMNRCDYLDPALAWTGVKNSGRGCTLSSLGYESLTRPKSFHLKQL